MMHLLFVITYLHTELNIKGKRINKIVVLLYNSSHMHRGIVYLSTVQVEGNIALARHSQANVERVSSRLTCLH